MESTEEKLQSSVKQHPERTAFNELSKVANELIIGQERLMERLVMALLCNGHLLVEGAPGLAKTTAIKVLAERIEGDFHRIQFTIVSSLPPTCCRLI
jgi:MoxR-like ATPase